MKIARLLGLAMKILRMRLRAQGLRWRGARIGRRVQLGNVRFINTEPSTISIGDGSVIGDNVVFKDLDRIAIGDYVKIHHGTRIEGLATRRAPLRIGNNSWVGEESIINCHDAVTIGHNAGIGCRSQLWTHGYFPDILLGYPNKIAPVRIGHGCWLPPSCIVLPGAIVGDGAIVGTGSLVTSGIDAGMFATGIPCRPRKAVSEMTSVPDWHVRREMLAEGLSAYLREFGMTVTRERGVKGDTLACRFYTLRFSLIIREDLPGSIPAGRCVILVDRPAVFLPEVRRNRTLISISSRTYTKMGTWHEWAVIRALHDTCLLRVLPLDGAPADRDEPENQDA